jgi:hypothetical protein
MTASQVRARVNRTRRPATASQARTPAPERKPTATAIPKTAARELPGEADGLAYVGGLRGDIEAVDPGRPRVGRQQRGQDPYGRGLARPVGPEQGEDAAPRHLEVQAAQHPQLLVRLLQALHLDRW